MSPEKSYVDELVSAVEDLEFLDRTNAPLIEKIKSLIVDSAPASTRKEKDIAAASFIVSACLSQDDETKWAFRNNKLAGIAGNVLAEIAVLQTSDPREKRDLLLQAIVAFNAGEYSANSSLVSKKAEETLGKIYRSDTADGQSGRAADIYVREIQKGALKFLEKSFDDVITICVRQETYWPRSLDDATKRYAEDPKRFSMLLSYRCLHHALKKLTSVFRNGEMGDYDEASGDMQKALRTAIYSGYSVPISIVQALKESSERLLKDSVWSVFEKYKGELPENFQEALIKEGYSDLWPIQTKALERVFTDGDLVLSLPTSTGKTLLAMCGLAREFHKAESSKPCCLWITPYNALAYQTANSLSRLFQANYGWNVGLLAGSYELEDTLPQSKIECDILVATPEKVDALLRHNDELDMPQFDNLSLIVLDECHLIRNNDRGIRYENLIGRLKRLFDARLIALSAVVGNSNELATWLDPDGNDFSELYWRPTELLQAVWDQNAIKFFRVEDENSELIEEIPFPQPKLPKYKLGANLALVLRQRFQPVLVLETNKQYTMLAAKYINEKVDCIETPESLIKLAKLVRKEMFEDCLLAKCIEKGIAYHHADLPTVIKRGIEDALGNGQLSVVVSTTTLAEGVNFPIEVIILPELYFVAERAGSKEEQARLPWEWCFGRPIDAIDYRNISGRAGRALYSFFGQTFLVRRDGERTITNLKNSLISPTRDMLRVESALLYLFSRESLDRTKQRIRIAWNAQILGALQDIDSSIAGGELSNLDRKALYDATFSAHIAERHPKLQKYCLSELDEMISQMGREPFIAVEENSPLKLTNLGTAIARTGLSYQSAVDILMRAKDCIDENPICYASLRGSDGDFRIQIILDILALGFLPAEMQQQSNFKSIVKGTGISINHTEIAYKWILGEDVHALSEAFGFSASATDSQKESIFHFTSAYIQSILQYTLPWCLMGASELIDFLKDEQGLDISGEIKFLPFYAKNGVPTPTAVQCMQIGIRPRDLAIKTSRGLLKATDNVQGYEWELESLRNTLREFRNSGRLDKLVEEADIERLNSRIESFKPSLEESLRDTMMSDWRGWLEAF